MKYFFSTLLQRNETLFRFGLLCFFMALVFYICSRYTQMEVLGTNAWYKPIKFCLSIGIYSWTMGWYVHYIDLGRALSWFNWSVILFLGLEIVYIAIQASRGQLSHFNMRSPIYSSLYYMMALAASAISLWTAYIALVFFQSDFPDLPNHYVSAIKWGLILFVIFSFEGFIMGSRLSHTIGNADGGHSLTFFNWSLEYGDPRVAHFIGMHALQAIPILSFFLLKDIKLTFVLGVFYSTIAFYVLVQALQGRPFIKMML